MHNPRNDATETNFSSYLEGLSKEDALKALRELAEYVEEIVEN